MTKDFEELVNRLAKARNFEGGAYCLITSIPDEDKIYASYGGNANSILNGVEHMMNVLLKNVTDIQAAQIREVYKNVIIEDEKRRFQEGGASIDNT